MSSSTARTREYRRRLDAGRCVVAIEIEPERLAEALIAAGVLRSEWDQADDAASRSALAEAIERLLATIVAAHEAGL